MGRKKIRLSKIEDERKRKLTFKKRRIGLLKKGLQLSVLSGCFVKIQVYYESDKSLMEFRSHETPIEDQIKRENDQVEQYAFFSNKNIDLVEEIDKEVTQHGNIIQRSSLRGQDLRVRIQNEVEGDNLMKFFSFSDSQHRVSRYTDSAYQSDPNIKLL